MSQPGTTTVRPATVTPVLAYGNNAVVVCACGRQMMVRSLGKIACLGGCGRRIAGYPQPGERITHIEVWDDPAIDAPTYLVMVGTDLHQA